MFWLWLALGVVLGLALAVAAALVLLYFYLLFRYLDFLVRVFQEKPLFIVPRGEPIEGVEDVAFATADGLTLRGCYLRTPARRRAGVILFGLEFGSNRWASGRYCRFLVENGFDVFAFETRGQGDSDRQPGYAPSQWVTAYEVRDVQAALVYLKGRSDADPRGIGFFGISKGGSAGLLAAAGDPWVRCCVTDGAFATRATMIPYMRRWVAIVSPRKWLQQILPDWYYGLLADAGLRRIRRETGLRFPSLERALPQLGPRPWLMIHGGADTYIQPKTARQLFELAPGPKELWLIDGAKHNQALRVAGDEYRRRVLAFFQAHLGTELPASSSRPAAGPQAPALTRKPPASRPAERPEAVPQG